MSAHLVFIKKDLTTEALHYCTELWGPPGVVSYYKRSWIDKLWERLRRKKSPELEFLIDHAYLLGGVWGQSLTHDLKVHLSQNRGPLLDSCFVFNSTPNALLFKLTWGGNI